MIKNKISSYFVFIVIVTLFTVFVFIVQKSYDNLMKSSIQAKNSQLTKPIDLNLDVNTVSEIEKKEDLP